ncbi:MAG: hypothetical protein HW421_3483 [Ignavibacteria bacterium]|nr:hypothetical protein [Ignavibacteria bacterium]
MIQSIYFCLSKTRNKILWEISYLRLLIDYWNYFFQNYFHLIFKMILHIVQNDNSKEWQFNSKKNSTKKHPLLTFSLTGVLFSTKSKNYNVACPGSQLHGVLTPVCKAARTLRISFVLRPTSSV